MKNNRKVVLYVLCMFILFIRCTNSFPPIDKLKSVTFTVIEQSVFFNKKTTELLIDSLDKNLYIQLNFRDCSGLPFPINSEYHDTLTKTAFHLDFYSNNKLIESEYVSFLDKMQWKSAYSDSCLRLKTDTVDLKYANNQFIQVPLYAFHKIKSGHNSFTLHVWQDVFTNDLRVMTKDSSFRTQHLYSKKELLNAKVKFDITIPTIYKSIIYGEGLSLKNDSTFSPAGMDNTLWRSSYPDIYWAIIYPKNKYYVNTPYQSSTDKYVANDTFSLYHYYANDSIGFEVLDHDNLSRDDVMGSWSGSLQSISSTKPVVIKFDNVKSFSVSAKKMGPIN